MSKVKIATGDWIIVCDGRKALICRNAGDETFPDLKVIEEREIENPSTAEQGSERPGRVQKSATSARSAVGQTDWHDDAERAFLRQLAERLHEAASAGEAGGMILIAPPRALGMIRPALSTAVTAILRAEIDKDFVRLPIADIEKRLWQ